MANPRAALDYSTWATVDGASRETDPRGIAFPLYYAALLVSELQGGRVGL